MYIDLLDQHDGVTNENISFAIVENSSSKISRFSKLKFLGFQKSRFDKFRVVRMQKMDTSIIQRTPVHPGLLVDSQTPLPTLAIRCTAI